jgi:hypothetical protein
MIISITKIAKQLYSSDKYIYWCHIIMIINNSTNISKANTSNHLSLIINRATIYGVGNSGSGWGRAQKCGGIKLVYWTPS